VEILTAAAASSDSANQTASADKNVTGLRYRPLTYGRSSQGDGSHDLRGFSSNIPIPRLDQNRGVGVTSYRETPRSIDRVCSPLGRHPLRVSHEYGPQMDILSFSLSDRLYVTVR
jgi:hypothetical protein